MPEGFESTPDEWGLKVGLPATKGQGILEHDAEAIVVLAGGIDDKFQVHPWVGMLGCSGDGLQAQCSPNHLRRRRNIPQTHNAQRARPRGPRVDVCRISPQRWSECRAHIQGVGFVATQLPTRCLCTSTFWCRSRSKAFWSTSHFICPEPRQYSTT